MSRLVFVLNGPNLNRLGRREPAIYGADTLADVEVACRRVADARGLELRFHQSNREDELIGWVHEACDAYEAGGGAVGIAINPAAYTHTSVAILDALNGFDGPVIEIHITNVHKREPFRRHSYVSLRADGVIAGFGVAGYPIAVERLAALIRQGRDKG